MIGLLILPEEEREVTETSPLFFLIHSSTMLVPVGAREGKLMQLGAAWSCLRPVKKNGRRALGLCWYCRGSEHFASSCHKK